MAEFDYNIVKNPEIFMQNRLAAHSDHEYYKDSESAAAENSDFKYLLNGIWKFSYARNYSLAVKGFEKTDYNVAGWEDIRVPAHMQMEGYGHPQYVNVQFPWDGVEDIEPGEIPEEFNPVGQYVKRFVLPDNMKKGPVYISFQGVESAIALWLNGHYVGYSEDTFTPSEFDLTPYINRDGVNRLACDVFRFTSGSWCEDQDFFRFSGIFRDVYLYTIPEVHAADIRIRTLLDDAYDNATLIVDILPTAKGKAEIKLSDDGEEITQKSLKLDLSAPVQTAADSTSDIEKVREYNQIKIPVRHPHKWSAEEPYLYDLSISIFSADGQLTEYIPEKVGFRVFEMKDNIMCINGKRIVFNGTDRHEFSALTGRVLSDEEILQDIVTMKQNNINAIRTSHYPNKTYLYKMCDRYGLYLIDETNLETHGTWDPIVRGLKDQDFAVPGDRPEFLANILDRARSMYERDKNHTSILIWSCGNESYGGKDLLEMHDMFHKLDPTRLVHYEGVVNDQRYLDTTDMVSGMYWPVETIKDFLKEHRDKPYICCEYAHAMGNSCGSIDWYTTLAEVEPLYQGGFIWDYIDQTLVKTDRYGKKYYAYGGDFDDRPNDGSFSGDGLCYGADRRPTPKMQEVKYVYQPVKITFDGSDIVIWNKNLFKNLDEYSCVLTLEKEGRVVQQSEGWLECEPGKTVRNQVPFEIPDDSEYVLTVSFRLKHDELWADAGTEIAYGQQVIGHYTSASSAAADSCSFRVVEGFINTGVYGDDFSVMFSNLTGGLISYRYGGREMIKNAPKPNFWRPLTENDIANLLPFRAGQWKTASMFLTDKTENGRNHTDYKVTGLDENGKVIPVNGSAEASGTGSLDSVKVEYTYHLPTAPAKDACVTYIVHRNGTVDVDMQMDRSDDIGELPEFAMLFRMDADYDHLKWYGKGPEDTYADVYDGRISVYENEVPDNFAHYLRPQESGNKTDVRYAEVTDRLGRGLRFEMADEPLYFSALPYSPHQIDDADHINELPPYLTTWIRVSKGQMGVAGDDTWGSRPHPQYMLDNSHPLELRFTFRGI